MFAIFWLSLMGLYMFMGIRVGLALSLVQLGVLEQVFAYAIYLLGLIGMVQIRDWLWERVGGSEE